MSAPTTTDNGVAAAEPDATPAPADELAQLREELADTRRAKDDLATRVDHLRASLQRVCDDRDAVQQRFDTFQEKVRATAIYYAERHNWCQVVDEALEEMGLERRDRDYMVTMTFTGTITRSITAVDADAAQQDALSQVSIQEGSSYRMHEESVCVTDLQVEADEEVDD